MRYFTFLSLLVCILITPGVRAITVIGPGGRYLEAVELLKRDVSVEIAHPVATTTVKQVYHNRTSRDLEATFLIPVPAGAQVVDLVLMAGDQTLGAEVLDADEARRIYESIVRKMRDPALLEYLDDQTLKATIYPVPAKGQVELELTYRQTAFMEGGLYQYRFLPPDREMAASRVPLNLSLAFDSSTEIGTMMSPTHDIVGSGDSLIVRDYSDPRSEFVLLYSVKNAAEGMHLITHRFPGQDRGTFLLMISPDDQATTKVMEKDVVFVLDISGSMSDEGKIDKAKKALSQCIYALNNDDRFQVVTFSTGVDKWRPSPVEATHDNRESAVSWLNECLPRGGTNIYDALEAARGSLDHSEDETTRPQLVIFLTDGRPTAGKTDDVQILSLLGGDRKPLRVFTLGFGFDVNAHLLDAMAEKSRALSTYVTPSEDLEHKISGLFKAISNPVLTNLELSFDQIEVIESYPRQIPDLFSGRDIIVVGEYKGSGSATVTLAGESVTGKHTQTISADFPEITDDTHRVIRALYAQRKVAYLLDEIRRNGESPELVEEVKLLAKEFRLVTPYTSFLAAPDEEYIQAGTVSRGEIVQSNVPQITAMTRDKSGQEAFKFAQSLGVMKEADRVMSAPEGPFAAASPEIRSRVIQGRSFELQGTQWIEKASSRPAETVRIKYLSQAYFNLLNEYPELREIVLLGELVSFRIDDIWVVVDAEGEEELPAKLRR